MPGTLTKTKVATLCRNPGASLIILTLSTFLIVCLFIDSAALVLAFMGFICLS